MSFTHLHVHSEYSLVDGLARIPDLIENAVSKGFESIALTDLHNIFATVKFYDYAVHRGIKPIIGCEVSLQTGAQERRDCRAIFLCMNQLGYHNLLQLLTRSYLEAKGKRAQIHYAWLAEQNTGLIVLSGGWHGDIGHALLLNRDEQARKAAHFWREHFPDRYYIEIFQTEREMDDIYTRRAIDFAAQENLPLVATNDVCFLEEEQFNTHEVRVCIAKGRILNDASRKTNYSTAQYLKSAEEMQALFHNIPQALENAAEIAKRCTVYIETGKILLPEFPLQGSRTSDVELDERAIQGLEHIFTQANPALDREAYNERLKKELGIIHQVGYAGYFLIVADIVGWAKRNNIAVGPGRGSGAGSLVAYALGITTIDPLHYDLLFERLLNPERISMPDFDIDLCVENRDRVIEYIAMKYGRDKVSQIITFGSMTARSVIRDVGRVLGKPYGYVDELAKFIPNNLNITLDAALKESPDLKDRYGNDPDVAQIFDMGKKLEGLSRNPGTHAGGVVIAPKALTEYTALYCDAKETSILTHFDMKDLAKIGLIKFDFLGLKTLTIMDRTLRTIQAQNEQGSNKKTLTLNDIPLDDEATYSLLQKANTMAIFQLESEGIRLLLKNMQPDKFEDIVALVALYRPGPLRAGMVDDYIARKHGAKVRYPDPKLEHILKPTYGVFIYQEQVMQIAQELAGYTLGSADLLRRAIGKKLPEEMAKQRQVFITGACDRGTKRATAIEIFDGIEKFAGYGFNRSHSVAYALLAYQTAWLKTHHAAAFMSAVLSHEMRNTDKIVDLIYESRALGLKVLPPDINESDWEFKADNAMEIRYGLGAVRHLGTKTVRALEQERASNGKFTSMDDFCRRMVTNQLKQNGLEIMIAVGALDSLGERGNLLANHTQSYSLAESYCKDQQVGQETLFVMDVDHVHSPPVQSATDNSNHGYDRQALLALELESLGVYLSEHPLTQYQDEIQQVLRMSETDENPDAANGNYNNRQTTAYFAGVVTKAIRQRSRRGKGLKFILDNGERQQELLLYDDSYQQYGESLKKGEIVIVKAKSYYDSVLEVRRWKAQDVYSLDEIRAESARNITITMDLTSTKHDFTQQVCEKLEPFISEKGCIVKVSACSQEASADLILDEAWKVKPCEQLLINLRAIEGIRKIQVFY